MASTQSVPALVPTPNPIVTQHCRTMCIHKTVIHSCGHSTIVRHRCFFEGSVMSSPVNNVMPNLNIPRSPPSRPPPSPSPSPVMSFHDRSIRSSYYGMDHHMLRNDPTLNVPRHRDRIQDRAADANSRSFTQRECAASRAYVLPPSYSEGVQLTPRRRVGSTWLPPRNHHKRSPEHSPRESRVLPRSPHPVDYEPSWSNAVSPSQYSDHQKVVKKARTEAVDVPHRDIDEEFCLRTPPSPLTIEPHKLKRRGNLPPIQRAVTYLSAHPRYSSTESDSDTIVPETTDNISNGKAESPFKESASSCVGEGSDGVLDLERNQANGIDVRNSLRISEHGRFKLGSQWKVPKSARDAQSQAGDHLAMASVWTEHAGWVDGENNKEDKDKEDEDKEDDEEAKVLVCEEPMLMDVSMSGAC